MGSPENLQHFEDDNIIITGRSDIEFWCLRFSITPFVLFHLLKTVGNSARQIGEFLHMEQGVGLNRAEESYKNISIL
jgi:hypothetical protein